EDVATFASLRNVAPIITHASYLINLATTNPEFHRKSIDAMIDELDRAERLGLHAVVLHPGAHTGALVDDRQRLGVCFDTCHVFASGYEIRNRDDYERTMDALETHVGIENVGAF